MSDVFAWNAIAIGCLMLIVWLISIPLKDVSIIDIVWGPGFIVVSWVTVLAVQAEGIKMLPAVLATIWGLRLGGYLAFRNHGKPEDARYATMRNKHGDWFWWISLLTVFGLQAVVMWIVSLPLQTVGQGDADYPVLRLVGVLLWLVGVIFEAVGDAQLAHFKSNPGNQGNVLDRGLWRYTRHPNYFGDFCVWWGLYCVALSCGALWWSAIGPAIMTVFLIKFSGVGLLEKSLRRSKPGYEDYVTRTNAFFPWHPGS